MLVQVKTRLDVAKRWPFATTFLDSSSFSVWSITYD